MLFVLAGFGLIAFIVESALELFSGHAEELIPIIQLVEFVHQFSEHTLPDLARSRGFSRVWPVQIGRADPPEGSTLRWQSS